MGSVYPSVLSEGDATFLMCLICEHWIFVDYWWFYLWSESSGLLLFKASCTVQQDNQLVKMSTSDSLLYVKNMKAKSNRYPLMKMKKEVDEWSDEWYKSAFPILLPTSAYKRVEKVIFIAGNVNNLNFLLFFFL